MRHITKTDEGTAAWMKPSGPNSPVMLRKIVKVWEDADSYEYKSDRRHYLNNGKYSFMHDGEGWSEEVFQDVTSRWKIAETVSRYNQPLSFWREIKLAAIRGIHLLLERMEFNLKDWHANHLQNTNLARGDLFYRVANFTNPQEVSYDNQKQNQRKTNPTRSLARRGWFCRPQYNLSTRKRGNERPLERWRARLSASDCCFGLDFGKISRYRLPRTNKTKAFRVEYPKKCMISLLHSCELMVDNGSECGDRCCWNPWWESEHFDAGEEIDESDPHIDISNLTEGEDFIRVD